VDWEAFDLVVVRSTWDYAERRDRFLRWAERLPRVLNPVPVLRWNTDKRYLGELTAAGVPVVPTAFLAPGDPFQPPEVRFVVKPAISAGGRNAASYEPADLKQAREHVRRLHRHGRTVMVQPYLSAVDEGGETALVFLGGRYSHAVRKGPLLPPGQPPGESLYLEETIDPREALADERAVAERVLEALPFDASRLLYARIDVVPGADGEPLLLELELAEPSLFLSYADGAAERFAERIADALDGA
jgi:glutathione synthase/RimK-type ligase-like ATP-grasp enzyme